MRNTFKEYKLPHGAVMKNKLVLAPMTTYSSNEDLTLSNEEEIYYEARGKEFGMVITAATAVSKNAQAFEHQISIRDSRYLESMTRLAEAIKKGGAKAVLQLHHGGRMNQPGLYPNQDIVGPSAVKANRDYVETPRELKTSEVYDIIDDFVKATELAIKAGFDGVELHGANTYLLQQFFSPHSNRRTDEFGGSLEKRLTFPLTLVSRVIKKVREYDKEDFIVGYRFSPEEVETPGITLYDTLFLVDELAYQDLDYLHISLGKYNQTSMRNPEDQKPIITYIKEKIGDRIPIIGVGGLGDIDTMEDALSLGYDLLAVGLPALADTNFVSNLEHGKEPKKVFDKDSLLPQPLFDRLERWISGTDKGYTIKK